ncbi:GNAT family N-acetyltransferase, partial [Candidatus Dependentiae bacterium]
ADLEETAHFLTNKMKDMQDGKTIFYCMFDNAEDRLIGAIEIREPRCPNGQIGSWLNENYWGHGRYQEALDLILKEYFEHENVATVNAYVEKDNVRSLKAHQKCGFAITREFTKDGKLFYELIIRKKASSF